jgi:hypothetical protein
MDLAALWTLDRISAAPYNRLDQYDRPAEALVDELDSEAGLTGR